MNDVSNKAFPENGFDADEEEEEEKVEETDTPTEKAVPSPRQRRLFLPQCLNVLRICLLTSAPETQN